MIRTLPEMPAGPLTAAPGGRTAAPGDRTAAPGVRTAVAGHEPQARRGDPFLPLGDGSPTNQLQPPTRATRIRATRPRFASPGRVTSTSQENLAREARKSVERVDREISRRLYGPCQGFRDESPEIVGPGRIFRLNRSSRGPGKGNLVLRRSFSGVKMRVGFSEEEFSR